MDRGLGLGRGAWLGEECVGSRVCDIERANLIEGRGPEKRKSNGTAVGVDRGSGV